jgi:hypothetical protein
MRKVLYHVLLACFLLHINPPLSFAMIEEEEENIGESVVGVPGAAGRAPVGKRPDIEVNQH